MIQYGDVFQKNKERRGERNEVDLSYPGKKDKSDPDPGSILLI